MRKYLGLLLTCATGCMDLGADKTAQVSSHFLDAAPVTTTSRAPIPAATDSLCVRVDFVGRKLVAANPQLGMKPLFATIRADQSELFHVEQKIVYITDGLVKKLPSEAELASALAFELGRMIAEREARMKQELKQIEPRPPIQVPIGNSGQFPNSDMVTVAETARYDQKRKEIREAVTRPNPETLARNYLEKAGFQRVDFDRARPALRDAEANSAFEKQIKGFVAPNNWTP